MAGALGATAARPPAPRRGRCCDDFTYSSSSSSALSTLSCGKQRRRRLARGDAATRREASARSAKGGGGSGIREGSRSPLASWLSGLLTGEGPEGKPRQQGAAGESDGGSAGCDASPSHSSPQRVNTLAQRVLEGDVARDWLKQGGTGRLIQPILHQSRRSGSPFGVELELVQARGKQVVGSPPPARASPSERIERDNDNYHVYYVLSGSGRLQTALGGSQRAAKSTAVELHSGDIFALAPRVRYLIEHGGGLGDNGAGEAAKPAKHAKEVKQVDDGVAAALALEGPLALLSITVPVSLADYRIAGGLGPAAGRGKLQEEEGEGIRGDLVVPAQIKSRNQETASCLLSSRLRHAAELLTFQLPNNSNNRIAPVFDPFRDCTPFTCR